MRACPNGTSSACMVHATTPCTGSSPRSAQEDAEATVGEGQECERLRGRGDNSGMGGVCGSREGVFLWHARETMRVHRRRPARAAHGHARRHARQGRRPVRRARRRARWARPPRHVSRAVRAQRFGQRPTVTMVPPATTPHGSAWTASQREVLRLVLEEHVNVQITGEPGAGKTEVALQAAGWTLCSSPSRI